MLLDLTFLQQSHVKQAPIGRETFPWTDVALSTGEWELPLASLDRTELDEQNNGVCVVDCEILRSAAFLLGKAISGSEIVLTITSLEKQAVLPMMGAIAWRKKTQYRCLYFQQNWYFSIFYFLFFYFQLNFADRGDGSIWIIVCVWAPNIIS